jgi:hypothetical protein
VYGYDPETKVQSSQWKNSSSPRPKKEQRVRSKVKVLLTFFTIAGLCITVMHQKVKLSTKNTIWKSSVIFVVQFGARDDLWASRNWELHHDNAPAHSSYLIQSFLAKHGILVVRQAPYSPDTAPCDFWLFPKLKRPLKGSRFDSREDIMPNATKELRNLPDVAFQKCFQQWKERWTKCV